jgi:hypothetical protein
MRSSSVFWRLLLALPLLLGRAAGADRPPAADPQAVATLGTPRQQLPAPIHDEATCAFCQAAIFPPLAPQPADVSLGEQGPVRQQQPAPEARVPHFASHRQASSRAPPALRSV